MNGSQHKAITLVANTHKPHEEVD
uniref:Uncharacterized protein n=1 Tax=Arundo donax TaxID=35708 RepID=A0A0A8YXM7_ARUDO